MDAHDRKSVLRRLIDADVDEHDSDLSELSAFRRSLLEPIEESDRGAVEEPAVLLAHTGRSWGP